LLKVVAGGAEVSGMTNNELIAHLNTTNIRGTTCSHIHYERGGNAWCGRPSVTTHGMPLCGPHRDSELEDLLRRSNGPDLSSY